MRTSNDIDSVCLSGPATTLDKEEITHLVPGRVRGKSLHHNQVVSIPCGCLLSPLFCTVDSSASLGVAGAIPSAVSATSNSPVASGCAVAMASILAACSANPASRATSMSSSLLLKW
jgi:hypothetical protein